MAEPFDTKRCYSGAFATSRERCQKRGEFRSTLGNCADNMVWCLEHAPPAYCRTASESQPDEKP